MSPRGSDALFHLGLSHHKFGRIAEAEAIYRQLLSVDPNHAETLHFLGVVEHQKGRHSESVVLIERAISLNPLNAAAHSNISESYRALGDYSRAEAEGRRAIELNPNFAVAYNNLGNALKGQGRIKEALDAYCHSITLDPVNSRAHLNISIILADLGRSDEAIVECRRALAIEPNQVATKFHLALLLLLHGEFEEGWHLYESRHLLPLARKRDFNQPKWDGGPLKDRRILLHAEQGFGDAIMFVRYTTIVAQNGGVVIVECPGVLTRLFRNAKGVAEVITDGDPLPQFDVHLPMASLPLTLKQYAPITTRDPYICTPNVRTSCGLDVGIVWAGNPGNYRDQRRSISPELLQPILDIPEVRFCSLQLGHPAPSGVTDLTRSINDFEDTAAAMSELDLIITVDTAVAHLAGAMGKRVWTLLPFVPDWRWGLHGDTTPWYPTMRLFRQKSAGDWEEVIERVRAELQAWASEGGGNS
ncbi:tetratricopeptide repeat protein [Chthoniobacter flavus]|nr:tetratricopeptide repeat-containing glycosyltransferase family protein [Chthoniobacter flavus]